MGGMKLVRDKIPEIMRAAGQRAVVHTADPVEFQVLLRQKLTEEVDEVLMSQDPEELADILEVLYALPDSKRCGRRRLSFGVGSRSASCGMGHGRPCPPRCRREPWRWMGVSSGHGKEELAGGGDGSQLLLGRGCWAEAGAAGESFDLRFGDAALEGLLLLA